MGTTGHTGGSQRTGGKDLLNKPSGGQPTSNSEYVSRELPRDDKRSSANSTPSAEDSPDENMNQVT